MKFPKHQILDSKGKQREVQIIEIREQPKSTWDGVSEFTRYEFKLDGIQISESAYDWIYVDNAGNDPEALLERVKNVLKDGRL